MDAAKIRIVIDADATGATRGMAASSAATAGWAATTKAAIASVGAGFKGLGTAFGSLTAGQKGLLAFGLGAAAVGTALKAVIGPAIEFESAFAGVRKTVDGSESVLLGIRSELLAMSKVMPTSAVDLAGIAESAGQLGVKAPDIANFTKVIAQLGETTNLSFESASQDIARFLNITGDGPGKIDNFSNSLVALGNSSATTEAEIVDFSIRLASAFTVAGASSDEIAALGAAFSSLGLRAEAGGSALSTIITKISDSARGGNDSLELFAETAGLVPEQFAAIARENPTEALLLFGEGLRKVVDEGGSVTPILEGLELGGLRTSEAMRLLALNSDDVRAALALSAAEFANGTARQDEYDRRVETTASRLEILRNRLTSLAIAAGTPALGFVAASADLAGDAIEALAATLAPLAQELLVTFGNGAQVAGQFWQAIGSPAAQLALATLNGAAIVAGEVLAAFNSLGPVGIILAGLATAISLIGPVSLPAAGSLSALAGSMFGLGAAGTVAAGGATATATSVKALNLAVAAGPLVVLAGALALVGKEFYDAGEAADAAGVAMTSAIDSAVASGSWNELRDQLAAVRDQQQELADLGYSNDDSWWGRLGRGVKGLGQIISPFNNEILNSQQALKELDRIAAANNFSTFEASIRGTSSVLGISVKETTALAAEMGLLDDITSGTSEQMHAARDAMAEMLIVSSDLADEFGVTTAQMLEGAFGAEQLADILGITGDQVAYVANQMQDFDFADLFSEDDAVRFAAMSRVAGEVQGVFAQMAASIGLTTTALLGQLAAVDRLAASHSDLRQNIEGAKSAMDVLNQQTRLATEARLAYGEAIAGIDDVESFEAAAKAAKDYVLELAGTGATFGEVKAAQRNLTLELLAAADAAGIAEADVLKFISVLTGIPPATIADIIADAEGAIREVRRFEEEGERVAREYAGKVTVTAEGLEYLERALADGTALHGSVWTALTLVEDQASGPIKTAYEAGTVLHGSVWTAYVNAEGNAIENTRAADAEGSAFDGKAFDAILGAELEGLFADIAGASAATDEWKLGPYRAELTADNSDAINKAQEGRSTAFEFAAGPYRADYEADNSDALSKAAGAQGAGRRYADDVYRGTLQADNSDAVSKASGAGNAARIFAKGPYQATLTANSTTAVSQINAAVAALANFRSRTITLTTVTRTAAATVGVRALERRWGGINDAAGVEMFAQGGIAGVVESPTRASIYAAATPYRVFAEPPTGAETFIPHQGNRERNLAIWRRTGDLLGFFADGAIAGATARSQAMLAGRGSGSGPVFSISTPINVTVDAAGGPVDAEDLAATIGREVDRRMNATARRLSLMIR